MDSFQIYISVVVGLFWVAWGLAYLKKRRDKLGHPKPHTVLDENLIEKILYDPDFDPTQNLREMLVVYLIEKSKTRAGRKELRKDKALCKHVKDMPMVHLSTDSYRSLIGMVPTIRRELRAPKDLKFFKNYKYPENPGLKWQQLPGHKNTV
jgi:hypothetical protein